eukprot:c6187_g2_i1 orf=1-309(+)
MIEHGKEKSKMAARASGVHPVEDTSTEVDSKKHKYDSPSDSFIKYSGILSSTSSIPAEDCKSESIFLQASELDKVFKFVDSPKKHDCFLSAVLLLNFSFPSC